MDPNSMPAPEAAPEAAAPTDDSMSSGQDCIPLTALAQADENEQMQPPAVGDKVTYTVEGTVAKIEGENAYVKKTAINGEDVSGDAAQPGADDGGMAGLESDAQAQSSQPQY